VSAPTFAHCMNISVNIDAGLSKKWLILLGTFGLGIGVCVFMQ
jgi:hypothetical protein